MDRRIRVREVRVIGPDGSQLGILPTAQALQEAADAGLNLVEVNSNANPPVCKIMDDGKFKYETSKRDREGKKGKRSQEVKVRPKTHDHDFDFKVKHARRFLEEGNKVRLLIQFRGREITHPETGRAVLDRVCKALADLATVVTMSAMEGNKMNMVLAPKPGLKPIVKKRPSEEEGDAPKGKLSRRARALLGLTSGAPNPDGSPGPGPASARSPPRRATRP